MTTIIIIAIIVTSLKNHVSESTVEAVIFGSALLTAVFCWQGFYDDVKAEKVHNTAVVDTKPLTKVEAHAWFDKDTQTLYVDSQWDRTALDLADDMESLVDADFEAKYAEAVREVTTDEEFAAWQAERQEELSSVFTYVNGNGKIRYVVRHVVSVETGDVIR